MQALAGRSFPPINGLPAGLEKVPRPRGLLLAGDLTDHCLPEEWQGFTQVYPLTGEGLACPVFETFGNHDGKLSGPVRAGIRARNAERLKLGLIQAVSPNGLHYSWTWNGIHFVNLGIYPGNGPDPTSKFSAEANDPEMSLDFLVHDLESAVGRSGRPVIVSHHFGFDEGMSLGWRWWTERERRLYYEALQPYNVIAILHGHSHAPARYRWPDPKFDPKEVSAVFGAAPPSDLKTYDVFSGGSMQKDNGPGEYFVFSITGTTFIAAHRLNRNRDADGWSRQEGFDLVKTISRGQAQ